MKRWIISILVSIVLMSLVFLATHSQAGPASLGTTPNLKTEAQELEQLLKSGDIASLSARLDGCLASIPAGSFQMGSASGREDETPVHEVYQDAFLIDRYEVTNAQYQRYVQSTGVAPPRYWSGSNYPAFAAGMPVTGVDWNDADAYCRWAGKRLPTEAEWEKACQGPQGNTYPWGDEWSASLANLDPMPGSGFALDPTVARNAWDIGWELLQNPPQPGRPSLRSVWTFLSGASQYGVVGMAGGAAEWVVDYYNWAGYSGLPARNPVNNNPPWNHVIRGSSWYEPYAGGDWVKQMSRCQARNSSHASSEPRAGFRCVK